MHGANRRVLSVLALLVAAATLTAQRAPVYPAADWERLDKPESVGWSSAGLERARQKLATLPSTGLVAVVGGRVLFEHGDVKAVSYLASVRKSILAMLYGNYVASGKMRLNKTLAEMGIDDLGGLSVEERQATIRDLLRRDWGSITPPRTPATTRRAHQREARRSTGPTTSITIGTSMPSVRSSRRRPGTTSTTRSKAISPSRLACRISIARRIRNRATSRGPCIRRITCTSRRGTWRASAI